MRQVWSGTSVGRRAAPRERPAVEAIAAAAVVASQLPGGAPVTSSYAPDFLLDGGRVDVPGDVPALAVRALDRVVVEESEWLELWEESDAGGQAVAVVQQLRTVIAAAGR
ncbi:DUF4259 domain-containing protein [Dactylosporangium sp. NPDC050688]|uniref:DUF4259 domain-containing protein n=1 Tax=Dactylosporangium sp. NPDC050688 TaxID=3157217 RepID=UPI0033F3BCF3